jgi:LemA protein
MELTLILFFGIIAIGLLVMFINIYNGLIFLRNQLERAWANIDVVLKQRFDEITQLTQIVQQYAGYESDVIKALSKARTQYGQATSIAEKIDATNELSMALKGVLAIVEGYPDLKTNQSFLQLQQRISQLENTIADRRESYNNTVANFNARIDQFPDVLAARYLSYQRQKMFKVEDQQKTTPNVQMNLPKVS